MMAHTSMMLLAVLVILVTAFGQPVQDFQKSTNFANKHATDGDHSDYSLASTVRTFYKALSNLFSQSRDERSESRDKRNAAAQYTEIDVNSTTNNETSFEYYEKQYFINKTLAILAQYLGYSHFKDHHVTGNNSSASGSGVNTSSGNSTAEQARPSAMPLAGGWTTDKGRTDPILEAKLRELNNLDLNQLLYVFQNVEQKQKDNIEDPSIASLCCRYG